MRRKTVRNQQLIVPMCGNHRQTSRIRDRRPRRGAAQCRGDFFAVREFLRSNFYKTFPLYLAIVESVDGNSTAGITMLCTHWVRKRRHRRVKIATIRAKGKPEEITLRSIYRKTGVRKISQFIRVEIHTID